jgi:hypothetical protein
MTLHTHYVFDSIDTPGTILGSTVPRFVWGRCEHSAFTGVRVFTPHGSCVVPGRYPKREEVHAALRSLWLEALCE